MPSHPARRVLWTAFTALALTSLTSHAADPREQCTQNYRPETGQAGKDVVWVPTNDTLVKHMLEMAQTGPNDLVYDLGAGDGKIAITAARDFGATAVGVEYNPDMALLGQCMAAAEGVTDKAQIIQGDIFETDFSHATVVTLYLLPELNLRLRPTILAMKPGTRVVSHSFLMDDWDPDQRAFTEHGSAYLWIVPADVEGRWAFREVGGQDRFSVRLDQHFQQLTGKLRDSRGKTRHRVLKEATLRGTALEMQIEDGDDIVTLRGTVDGKRMDATLIKNGQTTKFTGTRS